VDPDRGNGRLNQGWGWPGSLNGDSLERPRRGHGGSTRSSNEGVHGASWRAAMGARRA
jgi:hypothetical protein